MALTAEHFTEEEIKTLINKYYRMWQMYEEYGFFQQAEAALHLAQRWEDVKACGNFKTE